MRISQFQIMMLKIKDYCSNFLEILNLRVLEVATGMIIDRYLALMGADSRTYNGWGVGMGSEK